MRDIGAKARWRERADLFIETEAIMKETGGMAREMGMDYIDGWDWNNKFFINALLNLNN